MRLLKIVAVPAAIALLMAPASATEASVRSKILGKIQKSNLAQAQKAEVLAQSSDAKCVGKNCPPCKVKFGENGGECPDGEKQYNPDEFKDREGLYIFPDVAIINIQPINGLPSPSTDYVDISQPPYISEDPVPEVLYNDIVSDGANSGDYFTGDENSNNNSSFDGYDSPANESASDIVTDILDNAGVSEGTQDTVANNIENLPENVQDDLVDALESVPESQQEDLLNAIVESGEIPSPAEA